jgi:hypothetical protein
VLATLATLFLVPSVFTIMHGRREHIRSRESHEESGPPAFGQITGPGGAQHPFPA